MNKKLFVAGIAAILVISGIGVSGLGWVTSATAQENDEESMEDTSMMNNTMMDDTKMEDTSMMNNTMMDDTMMMDDTKMEDSMMMASTTFADVTAAAVITDSSEFEKVRVYTGADVPTDGSGGAFGYGVISSAGLDAIVVTTTHAGIKDSIAQVDADDASFHNHYVALVNLEDDSACPGHQVSDISYQQPGDVSVSGHGVVIEDAPYYFGATHSLSEEHISFNTGDDVSDVVYFTIDPVDSEGNTITDVADLAAVCINDIKSVGDNLTTIPAYYWEGH